MNIEDLHISDSLKTQIKTVFNSKNKKTVLFGYFNYELEKKTRLDRIRAIAARDYHAKQLERFCIKRGRIVLLGADRQSFTDKDFRILDKSLCLFQNGKIYKKSQIARMMLAKIVSGRKIEWHNDEINAGVFNYAPFYFEKGQYDDAVMIDLSRAHYSIYSKLSFDLRLLFKDQRFLGYRIGKIKLDSIKRETDKTILQRIYGAFASQSFSIWDGIENEKVLNFDSRKGYKNELYSPTLVFALMQTLHEIAARAVKYRAKYIYTDGYMFRRGEEKQFCDYLDRIGLAYKVEKAGNAVVFGYNNYSIGNLKVGVQNYISKIQQENAKERTRSDAFRNVIKEVFQNEVSFYNSNIDFSAVNFLTGKDMLNRQFNLDKR